MYVILTDQLSGVKRVLFANEARLHITGTLIYVTFGRTIYMDAVNVSDSLFQSYCFLIVWDK